MDKPTVDEVNYDVQFEMHGKGDISASGSMASGGTFFSFPCVSIHEVDV